MSSRIHIAFVSLVACVLFGATAQAQDPVTFNKEIIRILQSNCQTCHRTGGIAPFPLTTYDETVSRAGSVLSAVSRRIMPPWKPVDEHGKFRGDRRLSEEQIAAVRAWVEGGVPEGVPIDLPERVEFNDGWSLGQPDMIVAPPEPYPVPAEGGDVYRCFSLQVDAREDVHVRGVDLIPGNRAMVHHIIVYVDERGDSIALDAADPGMGYSCFGGPGFTTTRWLSAWAPGVDSAFFREGVGMRIPAGSRLVMQVHYSPLGHVGHGSGEHAESLTDWTQIGLFTSPTSPDRAQVFIPVVNERFVLAAGDPEARVTVSFRLPFSAKLLSIGPHMHLLGKRMRVEAAKPDGTVAQLIQIDDWDFNWQSNYQYAEPVPLPAGTVIRVEAIYDNSENNPRNPSQPPVAVRWGERTIDEMCLVLLGLTADDPAVDRLLR